MMRGLPMGGEKDMMAYGNGTFKLYDHCHVGQTAMTVGPPSLGIFRQ